MDALAIENSQDPDLPTKDAPLAASSNEEHQKNRLLNGPIGKALLIFSVPFLLANLVQALFGAVDMMVVSWYGNDASIVAVSNGAQIIFVLVQIANSLTVGGTVLMSQYIGAKRDKDALETISTMLTVFSLFAIFLTFLMCLFVNPLLQCIKTPVEAFDETRQYILICSYGNIVMFAYNAISAILRGMGDSKSPFYFILAACILNIFLDFALVGGLHWGVAGAAIATVFSQLFSVVWAVIHLRRRNFLFDFRPRSFKICWKKVPTIFKLGIPVTVQNTLTSFSFLFITTIINSLGTTAMAGVGIISRFSMFAFLPSISFSMALSAIVAQNIGAAQPKRAQKTLRIGILMSLIFTLPFFFWAEFFPETIMAIFKSTPEVALSGSNYIRSFGFDYLMVSFVFCQLGFFNGCGRTRFAMINGLMAALILRVPLSYYFCEAFNGDLFYIGFAAPLASLFTIVAGFFYIKTNRWQKSVIDQV